jgi:hypothetical protein
VHSRVETLYGKQGRGKQFTSKAERDVFLQVQIDSITALAADKQTLLNSTKREVVTEGSQLQKEKG